MRNNYISQFQELKCKNCKHYEAYHHYLNPNAVARHYCKKCKDEIKYKKTLNSDLYTVWFPKRCYFQNLFEESEASKKEYKERFIIYTGFADQIED